MNGLVLAVFLGTAIAGIVPAVISGQQAVGGGTLSNVLRAPFETPLPKKSGDELLTRLRGFPGVAVLPVYAKSGSDQAPKGPPPPGFEPPPDNVVSCDSLARFPALGHCSGKAVVADFSFILNHDNVLSIGRRLPVVTSGSPAFETTNLRLAAVMVTTADPAALERIRTLLTTYLAQNGAVTAPHTFGEDAQARALPLDALNRIALAMVVLTLLVAACSLVVSVAGGLVERKQPFTLLRLCGTPIRTLSVVVLLESALPLVLAAVLAAMAGYGVAGPLVDQLSVKGGQIPLPGSGYFLTIGGGLAAALLVILAGLPLLKRMTALDNARFE